MPGQSGGKRMVSQGDHGERGLCGGNRRSAGEPRSEQSGKKTDRRNESAVCLF